MNAMKYAETPDGERITEYKWKYGVEEYRETFSKTQESTACGPCGLHMTYWKAALEREAIMEVGNFLALHVAEKSIPLCSNNANHTTF